MRGPGKGLTMPNNALVGAQRIAIKQRQPTSSKPFRHNVWADLKDYSAATRESAQHDPDPSNLGGNFGDKSASMKLKKPCFVRSLGFFR
jgi:hypothetical protein